MGAHGLGAKVGPFAERIVIAFRHRGSSSPRGGRYQCLEELTEDPACLRGRHSPCPPRFSLLYPFNVQPDVPESTQVPRI